MEQQKLPNATISIVLGIISFIGCCCTSGFGGVVLSGIALFLAKKDEKKYIESKIVEKGDVILLISGGHGFKILEKSEILEVKQGPYIAADDAYISFILFT